MVFAHPLWLWLLLIVPVLALLDWRAGGLGRTWNTVLRSVCAAAVILALAKPLLPWRDATATTVSVIDLGPAVLPADARAALKAAPMGSPVIVFSARSELLTNPAVLDDAKSLADLRQRLAKPLWADDPTHGRANLADALRLAGTQIPTGAHGHIKLFSSGASDHGDAAAEAWRLAQRGISIESNAAAVTPAGSVIVKSMKVPASARVGQTVRVEITVEAVMAGRASVRLTAGDGTPVTLSATLAAGVNHLSAQLPLEKPGRTPVHAIAWTGDSTPATQPIGDVKVSAAIQVNAPANVLLVQDAPDAGLSDAIAALLGPSAAVKSISPEELATQDPSTADAVILADLPADRLTAASQASLRQAVLGGTGLLLTGAARSFGPGGYDDSQLASLLPVKMPQQMETIDPSTTLVLIIDTSGSMQGDRINLAKEVARLAISHLKPHDKVGIVEFYGGKRWAAPIQSAGNMAVIHRALDRLTAGGGTTLYPAVEEAAFALRNVHTRSKHVLICSDGDVENSPFSVLLPRMADDGIVISTAQVAPNHGGPNQMADIARWGNGRYYIVPDQFALPDLSFKQPQMSLTSPLVRTASDLVPGDDALLRDGSDATSTDAFGQVNGYVRTQAKPTADVLLKTSSGDPLLARWRYGSSFVAAMPTQLGSAMTAGLQNNPAFAKLLADLLRQIDSGRGERLRITTTVRPAGVEADITAANASSAIGTLGLTVTDSSEKMVRTTNAEAIGPAHWNILLPNLSAGAYTLTATLADGQVGHAAVGVAPPQPVLSTDYALLDQVGSFAKLAAERSAALPTARVEFVDLQKLLAVLAAVFLLAQVTVRRWPVGRALGAAVSEPLPVTLS